MSTAQRCNPTCVSCDQRRLQASVAHGLQATLHLGIGWCFETTHYYANSPFLAEPVAPRTQIAPTNAECNATQRLRIAAAPLPPNNGWPYWGVLRKEVACFLVVR
jgi:hypothetical protein